MVLRMFHMAILTQAPQLLNWRRSSRLTLTYATVVRVCASNANSSQYWKRPREFSTKREQASNTTVQMTKAIDRLVWLSSGSNAPRVARGGFSPSLHNTLPADVPRHRRTAACETATRRMFGRAWCHRAASLRRACESTRYNENSTPHHSSWPP